MMLLPAHMEISASLMVAYRFGDEGLIEVDASGLYRLTDGAGVVLEDTLTSGGMRIGWRGWQGWGDVLGTLAAFLSHDAELWEFSPEGLWGASASFSGCWP